MAVPVHVPIAGVMVYLTTAGLVLVFVSVWAIVDPLLVENPPVRLPLIKAAVHEYVTAPVVVVLNAILVAVALHMVVAAGVAIAIGVGFTVTSKLNGVPGQPVGPVGVITYLITPNEVPVLSNCSFKDAPEPLLFPVIVPPVGAVNIEDVHAKVVPVVAEVMVYPTNALSHIVFVLALLIVGVGFTVIVNV